MSKRIILPGDVRWRENLARDIAKLRKEVAGKPSRRAFLLGAGALAAAVNEYVDLNRAYAMFVHGGGAIPGSINAITNMRTGATHQYLPQALYTGALTGDTILIPAGTFAPAYPTIPYSDYRQIDSRYWGFSGTAGGFGNMYIGPGFTTGGSWSNASNADYLTLQAVGTANNGRAAFSTPYATLAEDFLTTDTEMHFTSAADLALWPNPGQVGSGFIAYGDGSAFCYQHFAYALSYTAIDLAKKKFTGVTGTGPGVTIPAGTMIVRGVPNGQAILFSISPNPGNTFTNLELWGAPGFDLHSICNPIRQGFYIPGQIPLGSTTLNNCYFHDCMQGFGLGEATLTDGVFAHVFDCEFYRCGMPNGFNHNLYFGPQSEVIFDNSYTHFTQGSHLYKSRAALNFVRYSRNTGERTDSNPGGAESCNFDISNGGLLYIIGNAIQQSLNASNHAIQVSGDGATTGEGNALHPIQESYIINNTIAGQANGTGYAGGSGPGFACAWAPIQVWNLGLQRPECPKISTNVAGSLPARQYFASNTCSLSGAETNGSVLYGNFAAAGVVAELEIPANSVAVVDSPVTPRSGATGFNTYIGYGDPILYQNPATLGPFSSGNTWFWDAAHTQPIFSESAGGSLPQTKIYVGITYQFPLGESVLLATMGYANFNLGGTNVASLDAALNPIPLANYFTGAWFQVDANNLLTVNSPPSVPGATGWNFYVYVYDPSFGLPQIPPPWSINIGMSKQNLSGPIALGTAWTEPSTGFITSAVLQLNLFKQNASPQALGTQWTKSTSGLVNNNSSADELVWRRRVGTQNGGACIDEWWAVAPTPGTYTITVWPNTWSQMNVSCIAIKGALSTVWPFAADLNAPASGTTPVGATVSFTESNAVVVAMFRGTGTAGAGFTQIYSHGLINSEYQKFTSPQTNLPITETGGNPIFDPWAADAIIINSGGGVEATGVVTGAAGSPLVQVSITTLTANDILILHVASDQARTMDAVGQVGPPPLPQTQFGSPVVNVQNNAMANYYAVPTGGITKVGNGTWVTSLGPVPSSYLTHSNNVQFNNYSGTGSTFLSPLWATVIADSIQTDFDLRPLSGGPLIGAGTNPGSSPEGQSLLPVYELKLFGLPTPGTPIPAKTVRPNTGGSFDVGAYEFGI